MVARLLRWIEENRPAHGWLETILLALLVAAPLIGLICGAFTGYGAWPD